jgi:hypothetical protein
MRTFKSRVIATAAASAIALTTFGLQPAAAGSRYGRDAAALAAFALVVGTIAAVVAAGQYRDEAAYGPPDAYGPGYRGPRPYGYWPHQHHGWGGMHQ